MRDNEPGPESHTSVRASSGLRRRLTRFSTLAGFQAVPYHTLTPPNKILREWVPRLVGILIPRGITPSPERPPLNRIGVPVRRQRCREEVVDESQRDGRYHGHIGRASGRWRVTEAHSIFARAVGTRWAPSFVTVTGAGWSCAPPPRAQGLGPDGPRISSRAMRSNRQGQQEAHSSNLYANAPTRQLIPNTARPPSVHQDGDANVMRKRIDRRGTDDLNSNRPQGRW